jgi:hypothetical protein
MPLGHFFLAIDVEALVDLTSFEKTAGDLLRFLRNSQKDPRGPGRIWYVYVYSSIHHLFTIYIFVLCRTSGEGSHERRNARTANGGVLIPPALVKDMKDLRDYLPGLKEKYGKLIFE